MTSLFSRRSHVLLFFGVSTLVNIPDHVFGKEPLLSKQAVAEAFSFPVEKLEAKERLAEANRKYHGAALEAWVFTSDEPIFAPVNIILAREGTLLSQSLIEKTEAWFKSDDGKYSKDTFKRVQIGEAKGYAGLGAFGPGGAAFMSVVNIPSRALDLQVTINIAFDAEADNTEIAPDLVEYAAFFRRGGKDLGPPIMHLTEIAVAAVNSRSQMHYWWIWLLAAVLLPAVVWLIRIARPTRR